MIHKQRCSPLLLLSAFLIISACDNADGPFNIIHEEPRVRQLSIEPSEIHFTGADGVKDTVITFEIAARSDLTENYSLEAQMANARDGEPIASVTLNPVEEEADKYHASITVAQSTTRFANMVLYVTPVGTQNRTGGRAETVISVIWSDTGNPEIVEIMNPDQITIPASGEPEEQFFVAARVGHSVSIDLIDNVNLNLYDEEENRINDLPYIMTDEHEGYGTTPDDDLYVQGFSVNSGNSPGTYTVRIHAVDIAGTSSDTLQSTFEFVR